MNLIVFTYFIDRGVFTTAIVTASITAITNIINYYITSFFNLFMPKQYSCNYILLSYNMHINI